MQMRNDVGIHTQKQQSVNTPQEVYIHFSVVVSKKIADVGQEGGYVCTYLLLRFFLVVGEVECNSLSFPPRPNKSNKVITDNLALAPQHQILNNVESYYLL